MSRYQDIAAQLAERVVDDDLAPGTFLPSVRDFALRKETTATTVARAYHELADAGVVAIEPRRAAQVTLDAVQAARAFLRRGGVFRLAGSDDPALSVLTATAADAVAPVGAGGSYRGLSALAAARADGAALHLRHRSGEYNAPFAAGILADRDPVLVHLWRREQGLIVPEGNPRGVETIAELAGLRVARRAIGTGTRTLLDRLLREAGIEPEMVVGPTVEVHLDVALAVATGDADAGLGLRSAAAQVALDFVPLVWEPFQIATTRALSGGLGPILEALAEASMSNRIRALGGYDLDGAGEVIEVGRARRARAAAAQRS
jgi:molybdate-binding protein